MVTLRIRHAVKDFDRWKEAFDSDPVGRQAGGVQRYRVYRSVDGSTAMIDLDFGGVEDADQFLQDLRLVWTQIGDLIGSPDTVIAEIVEEHNYGG
jgi:hypothetical protein